MFSLNIKLVNSRIEMDNSHNIPSLTFAELPKKKIRNRKKGRAKQWRKRKWRTDFTLASAESRHMTLRRSWKKITWRRGMKRFCKRRSGIAPFVVQLNHSLSERGKIQTLREWKIRSAATGQEIKPCRILPHLRIFTNTEISILGSHDAPIHHYCNAVPICSNLHEANFQDMRIDWRLSFHTVFSWIVTFLEIHQNIRSQSVIGWKSMFLSLKWKFENPFFSLTKAVRSELQESATQEIWGSILISSETGVIASMSSTHEPDNLTPSGQALGQEADPYPSRKMPRSFLRTPKNLTAIKIIICGDRSLISVRWFYFLSSVFIAHIWCAGMRGAGSEQCSRTRRIRQACCALSLWTGIEFHHSQCECDIVWHFQRNVSFWSH